MLRQNIDKAVIITYSGCSESCCGVRATTALARRVLDPVAGRCLLTFMAYLVAVVRSIVFRSSGDRLDRHISKTPISQSPTHGDYLCLFRGFRTQRHDG